MFPWAVDMVEVGGQRLMVQDGVMVGGQDGAVIGHMVVAITALMQVTMLHQWSMHLLLQ
jgi:hypothetical protein